MQDLLKNGKKTKVTLSDYNFAEDVKNRLFLKKLDTQAIGVLEEILFSSIQFPIDSLADNLDLEIDDVYTIIESLAPLNLFNFDGRILTVDKDKRKYFETQIARFDSDFKPNLEYFQNLLKSLPIEVLPNWYHVPRTSNHIFQSIIDKHLLTPQTYQRYLTELLSGDDLVAKVGKEIFSEESLTIPAQTIRIKYNLSKEEFEALAIALEFNILGFVSFSNGIEVLTPFYEWQQYQLFLKESTPASINDEVVPFRTYEYAFIQDMTTLLTLCSTSDLEVFYFREKEAWQPTSASQTLIEAHIPVGKDYSIKLLGKLLVLGLAVVEETFLKPTKAAKEWIQIPVAQRAHVTFKHPHNFLSTQKSYALATQRVIIDIQKSLACLTSLNWINFKDFMKIAIIPLSEEKQVSLKKTGKTWSYALPVYTPQEEEFIQYIICEWLFESGVTQIGFANGKPMFRLTTLGKTILV
jgi:hypothetical protein